MRYTKKQLVAKIKFILNDRKTFGKNKTDPVIIARIQKLINSVEL